MNKNHNKFVYLKAANNFKRGEFVYYRPGQYIAIDPLREMGIFSIALCVINTNKNNSNNFLIYGGGVGYFHKLCETNDSLFLNRETKMLVRFQRDSNLDPDVSGIYLFQTPFGEKTYKLCKCGLCYPHTLKYR